MRALVLVPVVGVCLVSVAVAQGAVAHYDSGQVSYTQKEEFITLALVPGGTFDVDTTRHRQGATLSFTPSGKAGGAPTFFLQFWVSGTSPFIGALEVRGGQGGNAYFDKAESRCTLTVTRLDADGVEGSGACSGPFEGGGAPVVSFRFAGRR